MPKSLCVSQSVRVESLQGFLTRFKFHSVVLSGDLYDDGPGLCLLEVPVFPTLSTVIHIRHMIVLYIHIKVLHTAQYNDHIHMVSASLGLEHH